MPRKRRLAGYLGLLLALAEIKLKEDVKCAEAMNKLKG